MDFHSNLNQEMNPKHIFSYNEFEEEDENDVFFDELRRQVFLLTTEDSDDEEEEEELHVNKSSRNMADRRKIGSIPRSSSAKSSVCSYNWSGNKEDCAAPTWILNLWRTGNGTGVFIPQIVQSRRRNKPRRRKKNEKGRTYRQVEKMN